MNEPIATERASRLFRDLRAAIAQRRAKEAELKERFAFGSDDDQRALERSLIEAEERHQAELQAIQSEYEATRAALIAQCDAEYGATHAEYQSLLQSVAQRSQSDEANARKEAEEARWMVSSVLDDTSIDSPKQKFENFETELLRKQEQMSQQRHELDDSFRENVERLQRCRMWGDVEKPDPVKLPKQRLELQELFEEQVEGARHSMRSLKSKKLPGMFTGFRPMIVFLAVALPVFAAAYFLLDPALVQIAERADPAWIAIAGGVGVAVALLLLGLLYGIARLGSGGLIPVMLQEVYDARAVHDRWQKLARQELSRRRAQYEEATAAIVAQREESLAKIESNQADLLDRISQQKRDQLAAAEQKYPGELAAIVERRDTQLQSLDADFQHKSQQTVQQQTAERDALQQELSRLRADKGLYREREWGSLVEGWQSALQTATGAAAELAHRVDGATTDFSEALADAWNLPSTIPEAIRFGRFDVDLQRIDGAVPAEESLRPLASHIDLPAWLPFPERASLLLEADGPGRTSAIDVLKTVTLRLLTSLPAGKIRLTIIDPIGLGENFSAFMHLADFDEQLINTRIWTEATHIEKRLAELSEHMENVFQAYLRNDYRTIEEYNRHAGEVAEPYHILVVANFPANFTESAARRLVSIATSGARCGVYTLISVDTRQNMPHNFDLADLEAQATTLRWKQGRFHATDPDLDAFPISIEEPPEPDEFNRIVRAVGRQSQDSRRVEVPFDRIAPPQGRLWSEDSRKGIDVPMGRAGATKLQALRLGKGTSQHVLVAGKTGSGKSSLLHALITNLVLRYSPHEVEFYLIDFKKGVEFKTYATHALPHARAIAIESDREFGVSVLERLDAMLKERGDLFRAAGVQDVASYRDKHPDTVLPRVMLIVDEFQEFFVEDDALSQQATLLLDRLVRQGRAFGIHVLLGSQTLGGAYTLARSTLGQVAVRIALQCSETDAHLILSEENSAARLLSRPGEAIYNDANGLVEGNHPFQIAWLPDDRRDKALDSVQELSQQQGIEAAPIVFEGNVASDPARNRELTQLIEAFGSAGAPPAAGVRVWLGEAVAIKDATYLEFRRRSGTNLLIVGAQAESAEGMLATSFLAIAAAHPLPKTDGKEGGAQFFVLDGSAMAASESQMWAKLADIVPQPAEVAGQREAAALVERIASEVSRRSDEGDEKAPSIFLFISNLGQLRDLKKDEDDYGFGNMDESKPAGAGQLLQSILKDGPALGVHTSVWCDTFGNASRWLSNAAMREFEMRAAFQLNATDSSNFIDSPAASKLGVHRALLYRADSGTMEKFRPYGLPAEEWLDWVGRALGGEPEAEVVEDIDMWTIN